MDWAGKKEEIGRLFAQNFEDFGEIGASVSIWNGESEVVDLAGGFQDRQKTIPWTRDTLVLVWSATKALAAGTLLAVLEAENLDLERKVADFWPEFAQNGKSEISVAELLSHRAGLSGLLDSDIPVWDHAAVAAALAAQSPLWKPGFCHGYHARTFGFLVDELVRRLTGDTLGTQWRSLFGDPMGLDFWIGLPEERLNTVASVFPAKNSGGLPDDAFWRAMATPDSLTKRAFSTPVGLASVASMNTPEARRASLPALGGIGTASALGQWYAMLAQGGEWRGRRYFQRETVAKMSRILTQGEDLVTLEPSAFSCGFMLDPLEANGIKLRRLYGPSRRAFGHPGAGGSHAFADPENGIAFAYVMNQMEFGIFPNAKSLRLVEAVYAD